MSRSRATASVVVSLALLAAASCTLFGSDTSPAAAACSLNPEADVNGRLDTVLGGVSSLEGGDVWGVGRQVDGAPLVWHRSGSTWTMKYFHVGGGFRPEAVEARTRTDVWAVGNGDVGAVAVRWNGRSWRPGRSPHVPNAQKSDLLGVAVSGPRSVWAVGQALVDGNVVVLIEMWNGRGWNLVRSPAPPGESSSLKDVAAANGSVWAVGWTVTGSTYQPLAERLGPSGWQIVPTPRIGSDAILTGVSVVGPADVWAVGWSWVDDRYTSIVLHWLGSGWVSSALPGSNGEQARIADITQASGRIVVVGQAPDAQGDLSPVAFRSDGSAWTELRVSASRPGGLVGVAPSGTGGLIAVGATQADRGYSSLVVSGC